MYAEYKDEKEAEKNLRRLKKEYPEEHHYRIGKRVYSRKKHKNKYHHSHDPIGMESYLRKRGVI